MGTKESNIIEAILTLSMLFFVTFYLVSCNIHMDELRAKDKWNFTPATEQALLDAVKQCPSLPKKIDGHLPINNLELKNMLDECDKEKVSEAIVEKQRKVLDGIKR